MARHLLTSDATEWPEKTPNNGGKLYSYTAVNQPTQITEKQGVSSAIVFSQPQSVGVSYRILATAASRIEFNSVIRRV
jgi:hypothetical protein